MYRCIVAVAAWATLLSTSGCDGDDGGGETDSGSAPIADQGAAADMAEPEPEPVDVCPEDARGTLIIDITASGVDVTDADRLVYGLFTEWPPMRAPARAEVIPGAGTTLPLRHVDTAVPPGDYAVYVCLDPGSDTSIEEVCNDGDHWVAIDDGALHTVAGGRITRAEMDLSAGTGAILGDDAPEAHGCDPVEPMVEAARLTVTLVSDAVMPAPGDLGGVFLFESFPPMGPPAKVAIGPLMGFPTDYDIEDIAPGDYYVAACHDAGGDSPSCDADGDLLVWHAGGQQAVSFAAGEDKALEVRLEP